MSKSKVLKGFKFRLCPTPEEEAVLSQHGGNARFLWNSMLALNQLEYKKSKTFVFYTAMAKMLPKMKQENFPFLRESHSQSLQQVCKDLDHALRGCFRDGKGFPRFKRKGDARDSFTIHQKFKIRRERIYIPKIGWVEWVKHRALQGKPKGITISQDGDQWYVSVKCELQVELPEPTPEMVEGVEGVDLGLKDFLVSSTGEHVGHPKHLQASERRLKRAQRALSRKKKGSSNRQKAKRKVQRIHRQIRRQRQNFLHKLSHDLVKNHDGIAVEGLNVKGMMANHCLAKAVGSSGWGEFRRQLEYKATWQGKHYVEVERFYPSTQTCSECGHRKTGEEKLRLSDRIFECAECGFVKDRDENAAVNIKREGQRVLRERLRV